MVRWFRQTGLGTTTAAGTAKMVVTVMMVMLHCVVVHSASRFPTGAFRSPQNDNQEAFNIPDITSGVSSGSTLVEDREKDSVFSADQPLTPAGSASNQVEEGSSPDRQTGQDVSLTDTTNINSVLSSGVQELTSEILDATRLSEGEQLSNAPNTTTKKYDGADGVSGFASSVGRDELPALSAEPTLPLEDERKTDSVEIVTDSSLDDDENVNENEFPTRVSDGDEAFLSTPEDRFTQTSEDVVSLLNTVNDDSDLFTLLQTSMAPENDMNLDSQDSLSSSVEPFATSNDVMSWSGTVKRSTMKSELPLSSGKEASYTKSDSFSFSANPMQGSERTRRESLSTGSAQSKTEDPNITGETEWTKEAAILYTALDTSADPTKNPPAPEDIDGTKESPFQVSKELTIGPDGVSRDPGNDGSKPSGGVRGSPDTTEAPETATAILFLGRSSEESSDGASEGFQRVSEADGSTKQEKTALGDVTAAVRSSETAADSSSRDASLVHKVSDVHSTGEQSWTEVTKSDEHSRTSDALTSQSDVPDFATTRSDKKGQGKGSKKSSTHARVTPVRTTKVRRGTQQGESTLDNTQTTKSAAEAELMTTSEHLTDDTSTVLTTTEMSTTTTATATTTTTRRPLVLGDTCSSRTDCQKYINSSTCTSRLCVCAVGYFKKDSSCYAEPRNLRVTQRNDYVNISWIGDDIEYTVYINISNKYNTTFKMLNVTGTQLDFSPIHPGSVIEVVVTVSGSDSPTVTANVTIAPSSPERLNIIFVNDTCMEAEWSPGTGVTEQYVVDVMYLGRTTRNETTRHVTTQTTWSYCGLSPGEQFYIHVYAMSNSVLSRVPASAFDYTNPSKPRDGRLQTTTLLNSSRVNISWLPGSNKDKKFVVTLENRTEITPIVLPSGSWYMSIIHISRGLRYTINIQAVNHGKKSLPLQVTGCTAPGTVEGLTIVSSGNSWIELEWSPPAGDVDSFEYEVTVHKTGSRDRVNVTNTLSYRVDSLTPGTNYTLKVRVKFCNLTSDYTTVSEATSLEGLSKFEVHALLDSPVLNIVWEHPLRDKGGLAFLLTVSENNETVIYNQNITQSPFSVSVKSFGKCFLVTLLVTGTSLSIPVSQWISTPEKAPGQVVDLSYRRLTQDRTSLNISWSRPEVTNGIITEYRLSVNGTRGGNYLQTLTCQGNDCKLHCGNKHRTRKATVQGGSTSYFSRDEKHFSVLVTNLSLYENYDIRVTASTSQFTGPAAQLRTDDQLLDAVENFSGRAYNTSCLALDWGYPTNGNSSDVLQFVLRYRKNSDTRLETTEPSSTRNTSETNLFLCGLDYFTNYTLSIAAVNKEGEGRVQEKYFHTAEFVPEAVTDLTVHPEVDIKKPRTLSITWKEPVNKHGIIRAYYVIISTSTGIVREAKVLPEHQPYYLQQHLWTENFTIEVFAETKAGNGSRATSSTQIPAGVLPPTQEEIKVEKSMKEHPATSAVAELPASLLCNDSYGSPNYTGLIVSTSLEQLSAEGPTGAVPKVYKSWTEDKSLYYVPVKLDHHCKESPGQSFKVLLGGDGNCVKGGEFCNGFLTADTEYRLQAVMCTSAGCTYSPVSSPYRTDKMPEEGSSAAAVAAGVVVVLLLAVVGAAAGFFFFRRHRREKERERNDDEAQRCRMEDISRNRPVKLDEFAEHVDHLHRDSNLAFSEEYKTIKELSREYPTNAAELPACKLKNRYTNILPWDHTRVKLIPTDDEEGSDYINANYLPGYTHRREFIAAQGPLPATIDDFWRMVWENRVCIIVMLTQCVEKGKVKCEKYWPEENEAVFHGDLVVQVRSQSVLPDYIIRVIDVKMGNQTRMIKHFHFMRWPDHGCPEKTSMLLNFVSAVRAHTPHSGSGPILVHCSAGVGRTGTFIALDQLLQQIRQEDEVDIFGLVLGMRDCRTQMVQTENQYIYIHDCLVDALVKDSDDEESGADNDDHIYGNC